MPIHVKCPACGLEGKVPDQFAGKTAKCRKCGGLIPVPSLNEDATIPDDQPAPMSANALPDWVAAGPVAPRPPMPPPPPHRARPPAPPPPPTAKAAKLSPLPVSNADPSKEQPEWYLAKDGSQLGPFTFAQLKQMADSGMVGPEDLVIKIGSTKWIQANEVRGLAAQSDPTSLSTPLDGPIWSKDESTDMPMTPGNDPPSMLALIMAIAGLTCVILFFTLFGLLTIYYTVAKNPVEMTPMQRHLVQFSLWGLLAMGLVIPIVSLIVAIATQHRAARTIASVSLCGMIIGLVCVVIYMITIPPVNTNF